MAPSGLDIAEAARRLVASEAGDPPRAEAVADAVEEACRRLRHELGHLLGTHGVSAILGRALNLAKREHPILAEVSLSAEPGCFTALAEALALGSGVSAATAGAAILANLWTLLVSLLGEELGMRPVHKLWPHLDSGSKEIAE